MSAIFTDPEGPCVHLRSSKFSSRLTCVRAAYISVLASLFLLFLFVRWHTEYYLVGIDLLKRDNDDAQTASDHARSFGSYAIVAAAATLLQVFQVYPPVLTPTQNGLVITDGSSISQSVMPTGQTQGCVTTQVLMNHVFANSYGAPFVGPYIPPNNCNFNHVTFNLTVLSAGRQFDRLGVVYFGDHEIFRTSTAEPNANGVRWVYIKDMSHYLSLFQQNQKLIFDLGNAVGGIYTGAFNATLTANFFTADDSVQPADLIMPVSARQSANNAPSAFTYPQMTAINDLTVPRNIKKAVFSLSATGQIDEEFWFGNVLDSDVNTFGPGALLGHSPFREVQLYIDGMLAGVAWPFPIIFTGGVVPGLWRPIVGIDAFDLREDEVDVSPWLPLLCDGNSHSFEIRVAGISDDGKGHGQITNEIGNYWMLSGKLFLWLDKPGSITTGTIVQQSNPRPSIELASKVMKLSNGTNQTLTYQVNVMRQFSIASRLKTTSGTSVVRWSQALDYSNQGDFTDFGNTQVTTQMTGGSDMSSTGYSRRIKYPIALNTSYATNADNGDFTIDATIDRGQNIFVVGQPVFPTGLQSFDAYSTGQNSQPWQGSRLMTNQRGNAHYFASGSNKQSLSFGTTHQDMTFSGVGGGAGTQGSSELYERHVTATNGSVTQDQERLVGGSTRSFSGPAPNPASARFTFAGRSIRRMLGRGPG